MLPPPPPPPPAHGPLQSRQADSHAQGNGTSLNSWTNGWRASPTTNSNFAPGPSSNSWTDRTVDPFFGSHQYIPSSYQVQPGRHDSTINGSTLYPIISAGPLGTMEEPTFQSLHNVPVTAGAQQSEAGTQPNLLQSKQHNLQHSQYTETDWNNHRPKIKELYMDQNASLEKTMATMTREFGFSPSKKQYKEKFREWKWSKNLSKERARWMLNRAEQRSRENPGGKDTIFLFGEQVWTTQRVRKSLRRSNCADDEVVAMDAPTPNDITYKTPQNLPPSPCSVHSSKEPRIPEGRWTPVPSSSKPQLSFLPSTWNGHSLAEIELIKRQAHRADRQGDVQNAEIKYREALAGFQNLLSPTHEDTNAAAYELAAFYAQHDRMDEADLVLNWMGEKHLQRWGLEHNKTTAHFLRVVELFDSWSRRDDARVFLFRVLDAVDKHELMGAGDFTAPNANANPPQVGPSRAAGPGIAAGALEPEYIRKAFTDTDDPARLDYLSGLANALSATRDKAFEPLLLRLIEQCEKDPERLSSQILQTRCALVDLYQRLEDEERMSDALEQAKKALESILSSPTKKTRHLLEACIKVASLHVENGKSQAADEMFQSIGWEAEDTFGTDNEDTISLLIRIGKMYQDENMWSSAKPWFERALAASMTQNGLYATMTKRLEAALENEYYSVSVLTYEEVESIVRSRADL